LSGGLDSRLVLAAMAPELRRGARLVSSGLPESDEVRLAGETARVAGGRCSNVALGPADFIDFAREGIARNEEFDIFVQGAQTALHRAAAGDAETLTTGWDVDVELRGTYLDAKALALASDADVPALVEARWRLFSRDELASLLQDGVRREVDGAADDWLRELCAAVPATTPTRRYLGFVLRYEKRRLLMLRNRMIRFELESATPLYDVRLRRLLSGIPEAQKADNRLFAKVLSRMAPELAAVPYQRTLLPASAPVELWGRAARLEEEREALLREVYAASGVRVPYVRHYTNFDEWLTSDPRWLAFTRDLLESPDTRCTRHLLRPDAVAALVAAHRSGRAGHRAKLVYLLSLELYLREHFG
jgi:asparagine synthetase B (glutamine-hydrolysing)